MSGRMRRVDESVREVISDAVTTDIKDPRVGFVTVTDVKTSADLRYARVFVSVLGSEEEQDASMEGLRSAHGYLQRRVSTQLRLKHTPQLEFIHDDTAERAFRVQAILEDAPLADPPPTDPEP